MSRVADNLDRAADLLDYGWVQHVNFVMGVSRVNCMCLSYAICVASGKQFATEEWAAVACVVGTNDLVGWNDTAGRTQAEVVNACRAAAVMVRAEALRS